jgi:light-regulated signal transduction histidine kinase (bacteriophytochrome)
LKEEAAQAEKEKMLKEEKEKMFKAEQEAQRIRDEYKKKALIDEARDFVRHSELLFKERQQNFSNQEWQQFNAWFSHQMSKGVNIYDSVLGGLGQMLHSTLNIPVNVVLNFASTQVSEIGKLLILVAGVVIVGLMTLFFVKLFMRRFVRLFWNTEKV